MSILDRYLMRAVIAGSLLVLLALLSLTGFINFVGQLDNVGEGNYQLPEALTFVLLTIPTHAYEMFPVAVLLGALLGLGNLASQSELIVMRAAGISVWRLAGAVLLAGGVLMLVAAALGELIAPPAEQFARRFRSASINEELSFAGGENVWIRDDELIINIESSGRRGQLGGVYLFRLEEGHRIASIARALSAGFSRGGAWYLYDFRETRFGAEGVSAQTLAQAERPTRLRPELINLSVVDPDSLEIRGLYEYARYLRANALDSYVYEVSLWSRIANLVAVLLMAALALPFVFGPLRSAGAGQRLTVGVLLGLGYFIGSRTLASSGQVFDVNPLVIGWLPTAVLGVVVLFGLLRIR